MIPRRGDVYWFNFDFGRHMVVVVSRNTGRQDIIAALITDPVEPLPEAADIVPVEGMRCTPRVRGFIRCDQLYTLDVEDYAWEIDQVTHLSPEDMAKVEAGLKAALRLRN